MRECFVLRTHTPRLNNENGLDGEAPEKGATEPPTGSGAEHKTRLQPDREKPKRVSFFCEQKAVLAKFTPKRVSV